MGKWFFEKGVPGIETEKNTKLAIKIKNKIFSGKSKYQKIEVLDTHPLGRILVLDGIVQLSQKDEFIYHEMMANLPLFYHLNPKKVLIIGGGDGGVLREALKHPIKNVFLVDIDKKIIEISKKYLPFISQNSFQDKRTKIFIEDGMKFIKKFKNFFDVTIIDLTDPLGPSIPLFSKRFYQDISNAMTKEGVMITQGGTLFAQFFQVQNIFKNLKKVFPFVKLHLAAVPCYGEGEFSFIVASKKINLNKTNSKKIRTSPSTRTLFLALLEIKKRYKKLKLKTKYYSPEIHLASGILPKIYQIK